MRKGYFNLILLIIVLFTSCTKEESFAQSALDKRWDFNDMIGWKYAHQDDNPDNQCQIEEGVMKIWTRAQSPDRKKICTIEKVYTTGRYKWKTFISEMGPGDQASIGSWIYNDDLHEIDFEVGYGKQAVRDQLGAQPDDYVAYMTTQANPSKSVPVLIKGGWHTFEIDLSLKKKKYFVQWIIDGQVLSSVQQTFGKQFPFMIFCSVENLKFIGDTPASKDNYGLFDYVEYSYHK
ncbi:MAG: hypothetical protein K0M40_14745 [Prolixibacteraceae bacterium]|nr:hypothetical protein [Prolixibacteraceae bacterium]